MYCIYFVCPVPHEHATGDISVQSSHAKRHSRTQRDRVLRPRCFSSVLTARTSSTVAVSYIYLSFSSPHAEYRAKLSQLTPKSTDYSDCKRNEAGVCALYSDKAFTAGTAGPRAAAMMLGMKKIGDEM